MNMRHILLVILFLFTFNIPLHSAQGNFSNSGNGCWRYSETVIINNTSSELIDYQVFISASALNTGKLVSDGVLQPDLDDVRFADAGERELPYLIEPDTINPLGFYVRIPAIEVSTGTTISFYYGNSSATATSSAYDTFLFYDDFENLDCWKTRKGSWEILDGTLHGTDEKINTLRSSRKRNHSNVCISFRALSALNNDISLEWKKSGRNSYRITYSSTNPNIARITRAGITGGISLPPVETKNWRTYEITDLGGRIETTCGAAASIFVDSQPFVSGDYFTLNSNGRARFDDFIVRRYTQPEPSAGVDRELLVLAPGTPLCEGKPNPEGVVDGTPEFSWKFIYRGDYAHESMPQYAYRILVSTSSTDLNNNIGNAWDSGKTKNHEETSEYAGKRLLAGPTYFWKVQAWITGAISSPYSVNRYFNYALNSPPNEPANLLCDGKTNPVKMVKVKPELSWKFSDPDKMSSQEYYRILVSLNLNELNKNAADVWDSEKTRSAVPGAVYNGLSLIPDTTYYWKVMTWDDGRSSGTYSSAQAFHFIYDSALYPEAVKNLTAVSLKGRKIRLRWLPSKSKDTAGYTILCSTGGFEKEYPVYEEQVSAESISWTSPPFDEDVMYSFIVRTRNVEGYEERNENIITAAAFKEPPDILKTLVRALPNGKKISGNRFTLMAETGKNILKKTEELRFEFKKPHDRQWTGIQNSFKPKNKSGYACFWDATLMEEGRYNLKILLDDKKGKKNLSVSCVTVIVDHDNPDIEETVDGNRAKKTEKLDNRIDNNIRLLRSSDKNMTEILITAGSLSNDQASLTVIDNPGKIPETQTDEMVPVGEYRQITLEGAQLNEPAVIRIPYRDEDGNEVVDGTYPPVLEYDLKPFVYNNDLNLWEMIYDHEIDRENNQVVFKAEHFSLFCLMGRGLSTLTHPFNYPNPFGDDGTTFIYELAEDSNVTIKIYSVSNRLVKVLLDNEPRFIGAQEESWDGTDDSSPPARLANGNYFYRIIVNMSSGKTLQKTEKLVIMR